MFRHLTPLTLNEHKHDNELLILSFANFRLVGFGRTEARTANSGFKKLAVQWLIEHSTSHNICAGRQFCAPKSPTS
jgi:hypothetical protein